MHKDCPTCKGTGKLSVPVGERMKFVREQYGETQGFVADLLGVTRPSMVNIEKGRQDVTNDKLVVFAKHFETSADYLLGLSE